MGVGRKRLLYNVDPGGCIFKNRKYELSPVRAEPRDLYDLWFLLKNCRLDLRAIKGNFKKKFGYELKPEIITPNLHNALYRDRWNGHLSNQIANLPDFNKVLKETEARLGDIV